MPLMVVKPPQNPTPQKLRRAGVANQEFELMKPNAKEPTRLTTDSERKVFGVASDNAYRSKVPIAPPAKTKAIEILKSLGWFWLGTELT